MFLTSSSKMTSTSTRTGGPHSGRTVPRSNPSAPQRGVIPREEAVKHIGEVLHMIVEELAEEGKEIPPAALIASTESSAVVVSV